MTELHVLVPLNGSSLAERAVPVAAALVQRIHRDLRFVTYVEEEHEVRQQQDYLEHLVESTSAVLDGRAVSYTVEIEPHAPQGIADGYTDDGLLVMATSGHVYLHDHYIGSAAETVVRSSGRPVVLVGGECDVDHAFDVTRVVVPVDGSPLSEAVIGLAADWAALLDVPLWLMTVVSDAAEAALAQAFGDDARAAEGNYLQRLARRADDDGDVRVEWETLHGDDAAKALLDECGDDALIVMSTHGRSGLARIALGSVATKVVRQSHRPVVVQRPSVVED